MTVRKIRKEAGRSSTDQEAPIVNQADVVDISSGEEPARQEDPTPEAPEDPLTMVNTLVNLQDPILKTPGNLATPADTLVGLQDLQEPIITSSAASPSLQEPIVTSSAISPPPERVRLQEPIATTSTITHLPGRVHLQEPIVTSSVIDPSPEQGLNLSKLLSFDPASVGSAILEVDDHQPDPTGVASQFLRVKGLLSAPIDALVQDSDAVRQILKEIKSQLLEVLQIKLWPTGHLPFFRAKVEQARQRIEARRSQAPLKADITERYCSMRRRRLWTPRLTHLHTPKGFNFWSRN
ncbi:hypothetical protein GQ55_6G128600 [Panicum hallii var. hallii]|uniref:DUF1409 domain-containing protein n=1 Tax=Panicum hallii var. hallii TaxID=1504633 RepID=A0A2T7D5Z9_9POAL|nr:hypothetical protein GQ55_6G128600 [Panicum hallii var. hallii]